MTDNEKSPGGGPAGSNLTRSSGIIHAEAELGRSAELSRPHPSGSRDLMCPRVEITDRSAEERAG